MINDHTVFQIIPCIVGYHTGYFRLSDLYVRKRHTSFLLYRLTVFEIRALERCLIFHVQYGFI